MTPGIHKISAEDYHADNLAPVPSLSSSIANTLLQRSSLHAWFEHPRLNPAFQKEDSAIMDAGKIAHAILLEGNADNLVVVNANDWRTKAAQETRDQAWKDGKIPVLVGKLETITAMVEAAKAYIAQTELAGIFDEDQGDSELTLLWQEGPTWCRARPDRWSRDRKVMLDYKTGAGSAEPNGWARQMMSMGYDVQNGLYRRGARAVVPSLGVDDPAFVFLVQENDPPFVCSLVSMSPPLIDLADRKVAYALDLWKANMAMNQWRGYPRFICHVEAPEYAVRSFEDLLDVANTG